jgi:hypothetical protein
MWVRMGLAAPFLIVLLTTFAVSSRPGRDVATQVGTPARAEDRASWTFPLRLDLVDAANRRTPPGPGWIAYDGEPYHPDRGYGWTEELPADSRSFDRGENATIVLASGTTTSPRLLGRPELAHWHGRHRENRPLVFRVDLPDGWYRVACTSVDPGAVLPVVDQRSFKCRAHDVVFAGPAHGAPLSVDGKTLVEGADTVEVTDGHLRIVVGDPAYAGWTWQHPGQWYEGWSAWFGRRGFSNYAERWYQKLTRTVDPGFHTVRLNSLDIRPAPPLDRAGTIVFRDRFNRDDARDINTGVPAARQWRRVALDAGPDVIDERVYATALALTATARSSIGIVQLPPTTDASLLRYSTRVAVSNGEGSAAGSGIQEAGLLFAVDPERPSEATSTFVGVRFGQERAGLIIRVGDGQRGYRTDFTVPAETFPFALVAGEYELAVDHDFDQRTLTRIALNGVDLTAAVPLQHRQPLLARGLVGIRAAFDPRRSGVPLSQFYWEYRLESLPRALARSARAECRGPRCPS